MVTSNVLNNLHGSRSIFEAMDAVWVIPHGKTAAMLESKLNRKAVSSK